ncbi:CYTH and CHAD domain-containing protein [Kocuria sp. TGY1127_2]|uniref:CYTH and CHAD domain-containing protein n=1 Tax=Kocuria sp. TGY1127_2 TaxID=2711328 RepID=UPI0015B84FDC|nr:CYTH and CHAD domain-containing protein [Kocuria sp. TGY1127_2]
MSTTHQEIERKYEAPADGDLTPDLSGLQRLIAEVEPQIQELDATYFDTDSRDLAREKVILRRRRGGHDEGWHIKFVLGEGRQEVHFGLLKDENTMPAAVKDVLSGITVGENLSPIARLTTRRERTILRDRDGQEIAELCDDSVRSTDYATGIERAWREWEVELLAEDLSLKAQAEVFKEVEEVLEQVGATSSSAVAKISRALGQDPKFDADAGIEVPRNRGDEAGGPHLTGSQSLISAVIHEFLDDVPALDLGVRVGVSDSVHQLRIRFRGIRGVLRGLRGIIDRDAEKCLNGRIKTTGVALSDARDLEVVREILGAQDGWNRLTKVAQEQLSALLDEDEEAAVRVARSRLSSAEHLALMKDLREFARQPRLDDVASGWGSKKIAKTMLDTLSDRLYKRSGRVQDLDDPTIGEVLENLHDVRKAAKSLRYAIESLWAESEVPKKRVKDVTSERKRSKKIQSQLGEILDLNVTREWLERAARVFQRRGLDRYAVGLLAGEVDTRLKESLEKGVVKVRHIH